MAGDPEADMDIGENMNLTGNVYTEPNLATMARMPDDSIDAIVTCLLYTSPSPRD